MLPAPRDLAQIRLDNALALFEEFVRAAAKHADAATLRGLERRFAERVLIQPSYWSQIKGRSRQIGERLARQFEQCCHKPVGWMDQPHDANAAAAATPNAPHATSDADGTETGAPRDDDERFIVGLVLTYYRRHPQRARTRLLDLLGEVLGTPGTPGQVGVPAANPAQPAAPRSAGSAAPGAPREDEASLWLRTRSGIAPLKKKR